MKPEPLTGIPPRNKIKAMNRFIRHYLYLRPILLVSLCVSPLTVLAEETPTLLLPKPEKPLVAILPTALRHLNQENHHADIVARVGTDGRVIDAICVEATHPGLIGRGLQTLKAATFQPGQEDGESFIADVQVRVHFRDPSLQVSESVYQSGVDHLGNVLSSDSPEDWAYSLTAARELDAPLRIVSQSETFIPTNESGDPAYGSVRVEFYVDHEGIPRLPKVLKADNPMVADAALRTLQQTRFNEPAEGGRPTVVKVTMPFKYDP